MSTGLVGDSGRVRAAPPGGRSLCHAGADWPTDRGMPAPARVRAAHLLHRRRSSGFVGRRLHHRELRGCTAVGYQETACQDSSSTAVKTSKHSWIAGIPWSARRSRGLLPGTTGEGSEVMDNSHVTWRKSSYSGGNGGNCVEVASTASPSSPSAIEAPKRPQIDVLPVSVAVVYRAGSEYE